jgi:hypothetical protein
MQTGKWWPKVRRQAAMLLAATLTVALGESVADEVPIAPATQPRLYDVSVETGMPHLEENLRYAVVRQRRCLDPGDLSRAFWMLDDVSLQDCRLERTAQSEASASYDLRCSGGHGTTGSAHWQIGPEQLRGTLDVKLGGKNMTFYQRVVARAVPDAQPVPAASGRGGRAEADSSPSCASEPTPPS